MSKPTIIAIVLYAIGAIVCYGPAYHDRLKECESWIAPRVCKTDAPIIAIGKATLWPLFLSVKLSEEK